MNSDRYRCIFRSTTTVFEITGISVPYSFPTISYRFQFREKKYENESDLASYWSFPIIFIPTHTCLPEVQKIALMIERRNYNSVSPNKRIVIRISKLQKINLPCPASDGVGEVADPRKGEQQEGSTTAWIVIDPRDPPTREQWGRAATEVEERGCQRVEGRRRRRRYSVIWEDREIR
jgi:hypothetical protein